MNTASNKNVQLDGKDIEDVESFVYLDKSGVTRKDIKARLGKAMAVYAKLDTIWKDSQFMGRTKIKNVKSTVDLVLLYGRKTCSMRMNKMDEKTLDLNNDYN